MYEDPTLKALIAKLNTQGPAKLRNRYYTGDPLMVAESQLPIVFVTKDTTTISVETNADDRHTTAITLNVVYKFTSELNQKAMTHAGSSGLYDLCEGRNTDHSLKADTIAYVLRANEWLDPANDLHIDLDNDLVIDYNISPPSRRGILNVEAIIRTTLITNRPSPAIAN